MTPDDSEVNIEESEPDINHTSQEANPEVTETETSSAGSICNYKTRSGRSIKAPNRLDL